MAINNPLKKKIKCKSKKTSFKELPKPSTQAESLLHELRNTTINVYDDKHTPKTTFYKVLVAVGQVDHSCKALKNYVDGFFQNITNNCLNC